MAQPDFIPIGKTGDTDADFIPMDASATVAKPHVKMEESVAPKAARAVTGSLPVAGGMGGAVLGAPAGGLGAVAGGGLGAAAGETARQYINKQIFGDGPSPISKEGLTDTAIAGGIGAASEVPGALATGIGNRAMSNIAGAVPRGEVGDATNALRNTTGISQKGLQVGLRKDTESTSNELASALQSSNGQSRVSQVLQPARKLAIDANQQLPGVLKRFDREVTAAKINAGITGKTASADDLVNLQHELAAFKPLEPTPVTKVMKDPLRQAYTDIGSMVRSMAPDADQPLSKLTDIHAAQSGLNKYPVSNTQAFGMAAARNPRTTAIISPVASAAAVGGGEAAQSKAKGIASRLVSIRH